MTDSVERFSNRVANYIKYRPDYPADIVTYLTDHCGLKPEHIVADIGCGPGQSTRPFLANGNRVIGVEPNDAMRSAAIECLVEFPDFSIVDGTSAATTLDGESVDFVVAAQAFHWFDPESTHAEFKRVLKHDGWCVLMWNERQLDTTPFLIEYEQLLLRYATDYKTVRHENVDQGRLADFFQADYQSATFLNYQDFDLDGLRGRLFSSSYMPDENAPEAESITKELSDLLAKHGENGRIKVFYDTNVYSSRI